MSTECICQAIPFLGERPLQACPVHCQAPKAPRGTFEASLVGAVGDHHECYIVTMPEGKRVVGGTRDELDIFWRDYVYKPDVEWAQYVTRDGTVLDDNDNGPDGLKR